MFIGRKDLDGVSDSNPADRYCRIDGNDSIQMNDTVDAHFRPIADSGSVEKD
jgi:hypothetical protein